MKTNKKRPAAGGLHTIGIIETKKKEEEITATATNMEQKDVFPFFRFKLVHLLLTNVNC